MLKTGQEKKLFSYTSTLPTHIDKQDYALNKSVTTYTFKTEHKYTFDEIPYVINNEMRD